MKLINKRRRDFTYNIVKITILYIITKWSYTQVLSLELINKGKRRKKNN
jgi:hypothetical protein